MTHDVTVFVVICLVGTNLANNLVSTCATLICEDLAVGNPTLVATVTVGPILFLIGELGPKELFRRQPDRLLYASAPLLGIASVIFRPAVRVLSLVTAVLRILGLRTEEGRDLRAEERLRQVIASGSEQGTLTDYQTALAHNIFSLRTRTVRHAMVPIEEVESIEASTDLETARERARVSGRTRYPVYRHHPEQVVGVVSIYALCFEERPGLTIRNYVEPVEVVAPTERVAEALVRLRQARASLAIVAEGDRAIGIITTKDLVEEITGELHDL